MAFNRIATIYFLVIWLLNKFSYAEVKWEAQFENDKCTMYMGDSKNISITIMYLNQTDLIASNATIRIVGDSNILQMSKMFLANEIENSKWSGFLEVHAIFIGSTNVAVEIIRENSIERSSQQMQIEIMRKSIVGGIFVKRFKICVMIFYFIMQLNFGIVLDLSKVKEILRNRLRTCTAFICNYTSIPLVS